MQPATSPASDALRRHRLGVAVLLGLTLAGGAWHALASRFVQDDAFISFRYAQNLVDGHGLVYNAGEYVEGYSNFAWVLILAAASGLGWPPERAALGVSLAAWLACIVASFLFVEGFRRRLGIAPGPQALAPHAVLALLALNPSWAAYASGGLETAFFALLVVAAMGGAAFAEGPVAGFATGGILALLCLTRPDGALVAAVAVGARLVRPLGTASAARQWRSLAIFGAPAAAVVAVWLAWKLAYYGSLLPTTFYAKSAADPYFGRGLVYLGAYYAAYPTLLLALVGAALCAAAAVRWARDPAGAAPPTRTLAFVLGPAAAGVVLFNGYVAWVGGGFMEFKAVLHVYPLTVVVIACTLAAMQQVRPHRWAWWLVAAAIGLLGLWSRPGPLPPHLLSVQALRAQIDGHHQWRRIGQVLHERLPPTTRIALGGAGAIAYTSRLYTLDTLGLVDPVVARQPVRRRGVPGHEKRASRAHLVDRGVHVWFIPHERTDRAGIPAVARDDLLYIRLWDDVWMKTTLLNPHPPLAERVAADPDDLVRVRGRARR